MSNITIVGLGPIGLAASRVLTQAGFQVTAWNRSQAKYESVAQGVRCKGELRDAIAASPIVATCVADYPATFALLDRQELREALHGKLWLQLSTGTPDDARKSASWAEQHGIAYLDGAILALPSQLGTEASTILVSGDHAAYTSAESALRALSGQLSYLGAKPSAASALDFAILSHLYGSLLGVYHGALVSESEGISVLDFGEMIAATAAAMGGILREETALIHARRFHDPESSIDTSVRALRNMVRQAEQAKISTSFPSYALSLLERATASGRGGQALGAVVEVMREDARTESLP